MTLIPGLGWGRNWLPVLYWAVLSLGSLSDGWEHNLVFQTCPAEFGCDVLLSLGVWGMELELRITAPKFCGILRGKCYPPLVAFE